MKSDYNMGAFFGLSLKIIPKTFNGIIDAPQTFGMGIPSNHLESHV